MKRFLSVISIVSVILLCSCSKSENTFYQVNLLDSLMQGYYDGQVSVKELKSYGNFGIGTFNGANGELICLDGKVYQALSDGSVIVSENTTQIPFAQITVFNSEYKESYSNINSFDELSSKLMEYINSNNPNNFYAIKIHGTFDSIKVRSELKQKKPYINFAQALKTDQREFTYQNVPGTLVVMYNPNYMGKLNSYGLHMHFISDDRTKGGHVLSLSSKELNAEFDCDSNLNLVISSNSEFDSLDFNKDMNAVTKYAEFNK